MKYLSLLILGILVSTFQINAQTTISDSEIDRKVTELLSKMSVEEKVGQMTQININMILKEGYSSKDGIVDKALIKKYVVDYGVGSILNVVPTAYSLNHWHSVIKDIQDVAMTTPNKIPVLYGIDAIHGATYTQNSTLFPHNIGMAATRNPGLVKVGAEITAKEVRASGIRWNFDPCLDVGRNPLWSRFEETFGEDVLIGRTMADALIRGYEEDGLKNPTAVASCMKHYIGYSTPASGKDRTPSYIPERQLREHYLPQFQAAVNAGTSSVMINSGEINGVPVHSSHYLLTTVLRDELGFKGLAVTDWEDVIRLEKRHRIADSQKEAVRLAVEAGIDMSMVPHDLSFFDLLVELVKEGKITKERLDLSVRRILTLKYKVGLFDSPYVESAEIANLGRPEYKKETKEVVLESITLLKNRFDVLPLSKSTKVLVGGPAAHSVSALHSCWSYLWQGNDESLYPEATKSFIEGIEAKIGKQNVIDFAPLSFDTNEKYPLGMMEYKAQNADVIILALGEKAYAESPGVINDLTLDENQLDLARAAIATGKPVVLVLVEGRPRVISSIEKEIPAIIQAYRPAETGAEAIADVLFGDYNPNGRLPYSYPRFTGDIIPYDCKKTDTWQELAPGVETLNGYNPQWPFGWGLSYSNLKYSNVKLSSDILTDITTIKASVEVTNTSKIKATHTVELYTRDHYASITPAIRKLTKFQKIELAPGETKTVTFEISKDDLSFIGLDNKRITEKGKFSVFIEENYIVKPNLTYAEDQLNQLREITFEYK